MADWIFCLVRTDTAPEKKQEGISFLLIDMKTPGITVRQHRMVDMVVSHEQAKSMASLACATADSERDPARRKRMVSAAKARIAEACRHVSQESVQLHGGMGMSDEMKVSHTFRRLTMIAQQFGDADHHLERFAPL